MPGGCELAIDLRSTAYVNQLPADSFPAAVEE
jgi:hypothetical protein